MAGVVGALAVLVFVLVAPGLTAYLPDATLAAVVIVAACALIDVGGMVRMWRMSTVEFGLAVAAFLGVAWSVCYKASLLRSDCPSQRSSRRYGSHIEPNSSRRANPPDSTTSNAIQMGIASPPAWCW